MRLFGKLTGKAKKAAPAEEFNGMDMESLPLAATESAEYYSFLNPSSREMLADERAAGVFGGAGIPNQQEADKLNEQKADKNV